MKRSRTPWLIVLALVLIVSGIIGAIRVVREHNLNNVNRWAGRVYNTDPAPRYALQEKIIVNTPGTVRIIAMGGDIIIHESMADQVSLDVVVPYKPKKLDFAMMQRDGDTIIIDSKTIMTHLAENVSQIVFTIEVHVPAGTNIEIQNTIGDITLDAPLNSVSINATLSTIDVKSDNIEHLDAHVTVSGGIQGNAPKTSRITLNTGDADLLVSHPGTHTIRTTTGDVTVRVDPTLVVGITHTIGTGAFTSEFTTTTTDSVNTYLHVSSETGDITVKQAR